MNKQKNIIRPKLLSPKPRVEVNPIPTAVHVSYGTDGVSPSPTHSHHMHINHNRLSPNEYEYVDGYQSGSNTMDDSLNKNTKNAFLSQSYASISNASTAHEYPPPHYVLTDQMDTPESDDSQIDFDVETKKCDRLEGRRPSYWYRARKSIGKGRFRPNELRQLESINAGRENLRPTAMRAVAEQSKWLHNTFAALNISLVLFGTMQAVLCAKDMENSHLKYRNVDAAKKEFFDLGTYPMSGMFMILFGGVLDGLTTMAFLCGFCCECSYYRHYIRFSFMNLMLTITCAVVLFVTEVKADEHMRRYFKIIMHIEYGSSQHPETIYNFIDRVQVYGHCCGYKGPNDWTDSRWWETAGDNEVLPNSCCPNTGDSTLCLLGSQDVYQDGCSETVFATVGGWRMAAKYVVLLKTPVIFTAIIICSLLYKKTWEFKANRRINDHLLTREGALGRLFAQGQLQMIGVSEPGNTSFDPEDLDSIIQRDAPSALRQSTSKRVAKRLMSYGWDSVSDVDPI